MGKERKNFHLLNLFHFLQNFVFLFDKYRGNKITISILEYLDRLVLYNFI